MADQLLYKLPGKEIVHQFGEFKENNLQDKFEYLNSKAGEIAQKAKKIYPNVLIAGGLPPQNLTYEADNRPDKEISENFNKSELDVLMASGEQISSSLSVSYTHLTLPTNREV